MKITGSPIVCSSAALFTAGALLLNDGPSTGHPVRRVATSTDRDPRLRVLVRPRRTGATVVVTNRDAVEHTVSAPSGSFDTGAIPPGRAVSFVAPTTPGTDHFICAIHPSMTGQLVVG